MCDCPNVKRGNFNSRLTPRLEFDDRRPRRAGMTIDRPTWQDVWACIDADLPLYSPPEHHHHCIPLCLSDPAVVVG